MEIREVVACANCNVHWYAGEPAKCSHAGHSHQRFEIHRHRTSVVLPGGCSIMAVSFDPDDPYSRENCPDYGLYFDDRWQPPWPHDHLDWPDFGIPPDPATAFRAVLDRARAGERVEIGCLGGHGRTGTALACLAILDGQTASDAVNWVRTNYCDRAVETAEQEEFVARFDQ